MAVSSCGPLPTRSSTILSAGVARGVCNVLELPTDVGIEKSPLEQIEVAAIRATVNGAFNKVILGKDNEDILKDVAIDTVVDSVGAIGAQQISHWYRNHDLNTFTHKAAHPPFALMWDEVVTLVEKGINKAQAANTYVKTRQQAKSSRRDCPPLNFQMPQRPKSSTPRIKQVRVQVLQKLKVCHTIGLNRVSLKVIKFIKEMISLILRE